MSVMWLALSLQARPAGADGADALAPLPRAEITLVGKDAARDGVKDVTAELLARDGVAVTWATQDAFQPQVIFERGGDMGVAVWIDLSAATEARLYFRDSRADRFFLRALPLVHGIDEMAKEEIAHIVSNAVVALGHGSSDALSRSQAQEALHVQPAQETVPKRVAPASPPLRFALAAMAGTQVLAHELSLAPKVAASLAFTRGPRWGRAGGAFGGWMDLGYQFTANYPGGTVGASLQSSSARAGVLWEIEGYGALVLRFGLGAGVDRIHYQPQGGSATVDLAPADTFYVPAACLWAGLDVRLVDSLAFTARVAADASLANVHFDVHDSGGQSTRVLVPYAVRPGAALGLSFLF